MPNVDWFGRVSLERNHNGKPQSGVQRCQQSALSAQHHQGRCRGKHLDRQTVKELDKQYMAVL